MRAALRLTLGVLAVLVLALTFTAQQQASQFDDPLFDQAPQGAVPAAVTSDNVELPPEVSGDQEF